MHENRKNICKKSLACSYSLVSFVKGWADTTTLNIRGKSPQPVSFIKQSNSYYK